MTKNKSGQQRNVSRTWENTGQVLTDGKRESEKIM